jgi:hypothetical protein
LGFEYLPTQPEKEYSPERFQVFAEGPIQAVLGATCGKVLAGTAGPAVHSVDGRKK